MINLIRRIYSFYKIRKYNEHTIAEYFRELGAQIGDDCYFGITYLASEPYLVKIGNHVAISAGVKLLTHNLGWNFRHIIPDFQVFGNIIIEDNCNIGEGAMILPNITIGTNSIIAAGSVVTKNVSPNSIIGGNPGRLIGNTEDYFMKTKEMWEQQKPPGYMRELKEGQRFTSQYFTSVRDKNENKEMLKKHLINLFWNK